MHMNLLFTFHTRLYRYKLFGNDTFSDNDSLAALVSSLLSAQVRRRTPAAVHVCHVLTTIALFSADGAVDGRGGRVR